MAKILKDTLDSFALLALLAQTNLYNKINLFYNIKKQHHSKHFQTNFATYFLRWHIQSEENSFSTYKHCVETNKKGSKFYSTSVLLTYW